ncbi:PRC-barrel domain-containing protein [Microvirga makkahensis]|uniref:PRC-barrel domain containing protein n=1 Tax=Microvirga makkahensis TaxID=1128670 RepID=A0A7X3MRM7_9HYPH|nr:PRC-barrel domain-containing protein [Microvirga makkahensis]MXQ11954.1 PRC-barrel domain containing protein [Microvirga makkahensis]
MVVKHLAVALLGSALIAAPALAQTSPGTGTTTNPSTGSSPAMNNNTGSSATGTSNTGGSNMGSSGSMTQMQPGQWRASQLEGLDVYNNNNEKIGDISEMLVDQSGKIQAVVIGVGGFLGIGERDVAIPFDQVKFMNEPRSNATAANTGAGGTAGTAATGTAGTAGTATGTTATAPNTTATAPSTTGSTAAGSTASADAGEADRSAPDHAVVNMTKEQLQGMPEFKMNR